jgi:hypothetical protein
MFLLIIETVVSSFHYLFRPLPLIFSFLFFSQSCSFNIMGTLVTSFLEDQTSRLHAAHATLTGHLLGQGIRRADEALATALQVCPPPHPAFAHFCFAFSGLSSRLKATVWHFLSLFFSSFFL